MSDDATLPIDPDLEPSDPAEPSRAHHRAAAGTHPTSTRARPRVLLAIAAGGALGAPARYGVAQLVHTRAGGFPWATFVTNVSGSFALGAVLVMVLARFPSDRYLRPFVATGFLGAFTTFSTFTVDADLLVKDHHVTTAAAYAAATIVAGVAAALAGIGAARVATRAPVRA